MSHAATMFAFCWYFGEVAATKNGRHVPRLPACPALLGFFAATHAAGARMELKWAERGAREADMAQICSPSQFVLYYCAGWRRLANIKTKPNVTPGVDV